MLVASFPHCMPHNMRESNSASAHSALEFETAVGESNVLELAWPDLGLHDYSFFQVRYGYMYYQATWPGRRDSARLSDDSMETNQLSLELNSYN